jgi:hypothetical protein
MHRGLLTAHTPDSYPQSHLSPRATRVTNDEPSSPLQVLRLSKPGGPVIARFIFRARSSICIITVKACVTAVAVHVLLVVGEWLIKTERAEDGVRDMVD